ncbi:hypothetical protein EJB05_00374, partial [Eragrostis curvula]
MDLPELDYSPGLGQQAEILRRFGSPVDFSSGCRLSEFFLVLSVGRCKFRLTGDLIARILQSILGGNAEFFKVSQLGDRVFKFSVSSKKVGFYIYSLKSYECDAFKVLFHLWGRGGPQSQQEASRWEYEQEAEWTTVSHKNRSKRSYADAVKTVNFLQRQQARPNPMDRQRQQNANLTGANAIPVRSQQHRQNNNQVSVNSVFNRINADLRKASATSVFDRIELPRKTVFDRLEFPEGSSSEEQGENSKFQSDLRSGGHGESAGQVQNLKNFPPARQQPSSTSHGLLCVRCLRTNHTREACRSSIRCHNCGRWGHIANNCRREISEFNYQRNAIQRKVQINNQRKPRIPQPSRTRLEYRPKEKKAVGAVDIDLQRNQSAQSQDITPNKGKAVITELPEPVTPTDQLCKSRLPSSTIEIHLKRKRTRTTVLVTTDVRRSERIKAMSKGFKKGSCRDINCVACTCDAPVLTDSIIKDLGTTFCKIVPEKITTEALQKKKLVRKPIGAGKVKPLAKKQSTNKKDLNEDKQKRAKK